MVKQRALVELNRVSKVYQLSGISVTALKNVSLSIEAGTFLAIRGASGSGKSTLLHILGCLDRPEEGEYFFEDRNVGELDDVQLAEIRNKRIGFVFQSFNLLPRVSSLKNTELPLSYARVERGKRRQAAVKALESVGLGHRLSHFPNELSGGERQRVAIARAIVNNASVVLADEPTGNLDTKASLQIMDLFVALNKMGTTIVLVTHEDAIANFAKEKIYMKDGEIIKDD